jgi:hypothetical protein
MSPVASVEKVTGGLPAVPNGSPPWHWGSLARAGAEQTLMAAASALGLATGNAAAGVGLFLTRAQTQKHEDLVISVVLPKAVAAGEPVAAAAPGVLLTVMHVLLKDFVAGSAPLAGQSSSVIERERKKRVFFLVQPTHGMLPRSSLVAEVLDYLREPRPALGWTTPLVAYVDRATQRTALLPPPGTVQPLPAGSLQAAASQNHLPSATESPGPSPKRHAEPHSGNAGVNTGTSEPVVMEI